MVVILDNAEEIRKIYQDFDLYTFDLRYTANKPKKGNELLLHSKNTILPNHLQIPRTTKFTPLVKI